MIRARSTLTGILLTIATPLSAQPAKEQAALDEAEHHWRNLKRAALASELATTSARVADISAQLSALDKGATPDTLPAAPANTKLPEEPPTATPENDDPPDEEPDDGPTESFGGIRFGVGVSLTADIGKRDRIGGASLDTNGIVRVDDQNNSRARIMLESHYFFEPCGSFLGIRRNYCVPKEGYDYGKDGVDRVRQSTWGWGPFIALQPGGEDSVIDAIGMGLMVGLRRSSDTKQSFNFGIGFVIDPNTRVLGDGIERDRPLPAGETEVRFKDTSQTGVLLLTSFSF